MPPSAPPTPLLPMDPRFRRRRMEVRRDQGRRRLRLLLALLVVLGLTAVAWLLVRSPFLDVDRVVVEGAAHTPRVGVVRASRIRTGSAMVHVDESGAARRVEALPWIAHATVRLRWPGTVVVEVTERAPFAVTSIDGGNWAVLDESGRVLDRTPVAQPELAVLEGVGPVGSAGTTLANAEPALAVVKALTPQLRARTRSVGRTGPGEIELHLTPTGTVRLGPPSDLDTKLRAAERVLAQVDTRNMAVLDVRLPSSPVLTRE